MEGVLIIEADANGRGPVVVARAKPPQILIHGFQGPRGTQGASGSGGGSSYNATASGNIQSNMVVAADGSGQVYVPDLTDPADIISVVGVASSAANNGQPISYIDSGTLSELAWNWQAGPIYCALSGGTLTQTPPATGAVLQVAVAITPNLIQVGIRPAILRGS